MQDGPKGVFPYGFLSGRGIMQPWHRWNWPIGMYHAIGRIRMKHAETVTFGGSALDRAGEVRADKDAVAALRADDAARAILFWRGKVLVDPARPDLAGARRRCCALCL